MQKERYTPLYSPEAGIVADKIINVHEFQKLWEETFDKNAEKVKDFKFTKEERQRAA